MLTPTKHTNIKYSVIYIAGKVLELLKKESLMKYEDLKEMLINDIGVNAKNNINYSLAFLFSIGKIEYLKNIDAITLTNKNNEN